MTMRSNRLTGRVVTAPWSVRTLVTRCGAQVLAGCGIDVLDLPAIGVTEMSSVWRLCGGPLRSDIGRLERRHD